MYQLIFILAGSHQVFRFYYKAALPSHYYCGVFLFVCFIAVFGAFGVCSATMAPKITTGLEQIMMLHRTGIEGSRLAAIRYNYSKPCDRVYKALSNLQR